MPALSMNPSDPVMRTLIRTLLILPLFAATLAVAADKPAKKEGSFGDGKATGAFLTKEQLRTCLARQTKVNDENGAMRKEQAELTTLKGDIARSGDELKQKLETLDRTSAEAVDGYNEAVTARDKQIDEYQKRVDTFNARVDANEAERDAFGQGCNNRRYFEEDEIAIKKGK
jgi:hypothetical protein